MGPNSELLQVTWSPVQCWTSPRMENPQTLWTACSSVSVSSLWTYFLLISHQNFLCCCMCWTWWSLWAHSNLGYSMILFVCLLSTFCCAHLSKVWLCFLCSLPSSGYGQQLGPPRLSLSRLDKPGTISPSSCTKCFILCPPCWPCTGLPPYLSCIQQSFLEPRTPNIVSQMLTRGE